MYVVVNKNIQITQQLSLLWNAWCCQWSEPPLGLSMWPVEDYRWMISEI